MTHTHTQNTKAIRNVTVCGLIINILLSISKAIIGTAFHSGAAIADAIHSLSDSITDATIIVGSKYWSAPADENHPHGHQRFEAFITLIIGLLLGFIAIRLLGKAFVDLEMPPATPGWPVAIIALVSIVVKEILFHWTKSVGEENHSAATIANAWHHRSDAISSIPVVVSTTLSLTYPGELPYLDPVASMIVSLMLLKAACGIAWPAIMELTDAGATATCRAQIMKLIKEVQGVQDAHGLRTRRIGDAYSIDVHILVNPNLTVKQGHAICTEVSRQLTHSESLRIVDVLTHLEPCDIHEQQRL